MVRIGPADDFQDADGETIRKTTSYLSGTRQHK